MIKFIKQDKIWLKQSFSYSALPRSPYWLKVRIKNASKSAKSSKAVTVSVAITNVTACKEVIFQNIQGKIYESFEFASCKRKACV